MDLMNPIELQIRFLVHASFILEYDGIRILTDPWLSDNGAFLKSWFTVDTFVDTF